MKDLRQKQGRFSREAICKQATRRVAKEKVQEKTKTGKKSCTFAWLWVSEQSGHILSHSVDHEKIILGIDPGTNNMGLGVIGIDRASIRLVAMDILKLGKMGGQALKLKKIFETVLRNIDEYHPDELAIESPFYGKNVQSMLKLGRAQGVAIAAALHRGIPVFEYSPRKVKQSITGKGGASKEQVAAMLCRILGIEGVPDNLDITDALAVALCHHFQGDNPPSGDKKSYSGWKAFISDNPGRISER